MAYLRIYCGGLVLVLIALAAFWISAPGSREQMDALIESAEFVLLLVALLGWITLVLRQVTASDKSTSHNSIIPIFLASLAALGLGVEIDEWGNSGGVHTIAIAVAVAMAILWAILLRAWWREGARKWDTVAEAFSSPMTGYVLIALVLILLSKLSGDGQVNHGITYIATETLEFLGLYSFLFATATAHKTWFQ